MKITIDIPKEFEKHFYVTNKTCILFRKGERK